MLNIAYLSEYILVPPLKVVFPLFRLYIAIVKLLFFPKAFILLPFPIVVFASDVYILLAVEILSPSTVIVAPSPIVKVELFPL